MFFTREDILKIQKALLQLGVKDSELPNAESVTYNDILSIVQDGKNKKIKIKDFFNQISLWKKESFINITDTYDKYYITLTEAINTVPILQRKDGLVITFQDSSGTWKIYQFRGNITEFLEKDKWFDLSDYRNYITESLLPDEEDITALTPDENGNSFLALKDRVYDPAIFSGKGYKFVRKNIINIELATIKISVTNPTTLEGDIYFNINNKGINVHLSPTMHNTTKLVSEAIKDALVVAYNDYKVTVANSVVTLTRKYSGNISPTTFEMYNTGVRVTVEDSTTISERNIITQEDINKADTIYEIRYNFDLDSKTITIPNNCVLYFTSGKFYNGSINMNNTVISTLYEDILSEININGNYYNIQEHIKNHQRQLDDKQSQIDDKQQQITANDEDISLLQTRSTQIEETIKSIAATGGASQATAVTYDNANSQLSAINIQSAVDELQGSKIDKTSILQESGEAEDKVMSQKAVSDKLSYLTSKTKDISSDKEALEEINEIDFCDDKGNVVHAIGKDSASFKNLKSNGLNVLTTKDDKIADLLKTIAYYGSSSKNLFNKYDLAYNGQGCFIDPNSGKVNFAKDTRISHLIWLNTTTNSTITVSSSNSISAAFGYRFFDKDFKIISFGAFDNATSKILQIPENAVYFQFSYSVKYKNVQVEYGDSVTAYEEYNSEYEQKIKEVKEPLENINAKVSALSNKTKDISSDNEVLGNIDEIDFCDNEYNVVHSIGKYSASFKNLKSNGQNVLTAKDIEGKADKDKSIIVQKESLNAGDEITLEENHIHSCKRIMFAANINSVGTIEVGVGKKEYWASWFEITETNISLKSYLTSEYNPNISFAHGLTLKNNIQFIIDVDDNGNVDLRLTSSGNSYVGHISVDNNATKITHNWLGVNGKIRATSVSASLSDCSLSFTCDGYYKEIQVYGDSYIHVLNERRAYYYLAQNGYNRNIMLNAFPGEASKQALADLKLNLKYSAPKRILWAMGMNDLDVNETTPSQNWLNSVNEFISICNENNIIPILATIPSVVGGYSEDSGIGDKRIHKAKNDWVKSSGYRYVDFAKAVGANDVTGYWFNNGESDDMLESGSMRVHPTKYGAVALYHQLITDFPEILMK